MITSNTTPTPQAAAHTPTPWTVRDSIFIDAPGFKDLAQVRGAAGPGFLNPDKEVEANAAFICHAVNSHAALVAALEELLGAQDDIARQSDYLPGDRMRRLVNAKAEARAALAQAKGGEL